MIPPRSHRNYLAFVAHRLSGLALALFLPAHFWVLGLALEGAEDLDGFLTFAELPLVKLAEWGLVILLSLHMLFGLRLLAVEFLPWPARTNGYQKWLVPAALAAFAAGALFLWQVV
jgi:fumarate reductase subunit D